MFAAASDEGRRPSACQQISGENQLVRRVFFAQSVPSFYVRSTCEDRVQFACFAADNGMHLCKCCSRLRSDLVLAAARLLMGLFGWDLELRSRVLSYGMSISRSPRVLGILNAEMPISFQ